LAAARGSPHRGGQPANYRAQLNARNPRIHDRHQIRQIARSIEAFGFNVPILIDKDCKVIAGHGRILAVERLGWAEVPTICLEHLTVAQASAFTIADNRLTDNSVWDDQILAQQLKELSELDLDFTLEATGFEMGEIDLRIESLAPVHDGAPDPADALPAEAGPSVSRDGDLWLLGSHRLYCGNALDRVAYETLMDGAKAMMVVTGPPYTWRSREMSAGSARSVIVTLRWRPAR
jgi:hypothetical protein